MYEELAVLLGSCYIDADGCGQTALTAGAFQQQKRMRLCLRLCLLAR